MEEALGPRNADADVGPEVVPEAEVRGGGILPVVGRTPVQEGGSSSSGGGGPTPVVPMSLYRDSKRPIENKGRVAEHFGDRGEEMRK